MVLGDVTETIYAVHDEEDEEADMKVCMKCGVVRERSANNQWQPTVKQSEMLFVRGDSVVLISPKQG